MLTQERYKTIIDILSERDAATVTELAAALGISESTIRRDLIVLDREGRLRKVYGGATAINRTEGMVEDEVNVREQIMAHEKDIIAEYAATLINDDDFVYIDSGTTTSRFVEHIGSSRAIFVTNGIIHAQKLLNKGLNAYMICGRIRPVTASVIGSEGINYLQRFNFTKAFIGTNGIDITSGYTTPDSDEAMMKAKAIEKSFAVFVLADHSKFRRVYPVTFAELKKCCIITDKLPYGSFSDKTIIREVTS